MELKELKAILKAMREHGCLRLELDALKVELIPEALLPKAQAEVAESVEEEPLTQEQIEAMVFYSSEPK